MNEYQNLSMLDNYILTRVYDVSRPTGEDRFHADNSV